MTLLTLMLVMGLSITVSNLKDDVSRLERKIDKLSQNFGVEEFGIDDLDENLLDELMTLLNNDKEIKAIKRLREATGLNLKEAKKLIDQI